MDALGCVPGRCLESYFFSFQPGGGANCGLGRILTCPPAHAYPESDSGRDETRNPERRHASPALFSVWTEAERTRAGHASAEPKVWGHYSAFFHLDLLAATGTLCFGTTRPRLWKTHIYEGISPALMDETARQPRSGDLSFRRRALQLQPGEGLLPAHGEDSQLVESTARDFHENRID